MEALPLDELLVLLAARRALVVLGPGSTLAATIAVAILEASGFEPGSAIEGQPVRAASGKRRIVGATAKPPPVVVDAGRLEASTIVAALRHAGEADHVLLVLDGSGESAREDTRPDMDETRVSAIAAAIPERGLVVANARGPALDTASRARVTTFATDRPPAPATPIWLAALVDSPDGVTPFDLYGGGSWFGRFATGPAATADLPAALGALVAAVEGFGADVEQARRALALVV